MLRKGLTPRPEAKRPLRYIVRISRHGAETFGWEIYRERDSIKLHCSTRLFATRVESIVDSARAAATLCNAVIEPGSVDGDYRTED